jgi:hypothetical protein
MGISFSQGLTRITLTTLLSADPLFQDYFSSWLQFREKLLIERLSSILENNQQSITFILNKHTMLLCLIQFIIPLDSKEPLIFLYNRKTDLLLIR